jgi:hypothetical protein
MAGPKPAESRKPREAMAVTELFDTVSLILTSKQLIYVYSPRNIQTIGPSFAGH